MNPSTKDEIKGNFHEVKGKVKEKAGQVTNNPDLEAEGKAEHIAGKVEKKVGQIEKVLGKSTAGFCPSVGDRPPCKATTSEENPFGEFFYRQLSKRTFDLLAQSHSNDSKSNCMNLPCSVHLGPVIALFLVTVLLSFSQFA